MIVHVLLILAAGVVGYCVTMQIFASPSPRTSSNVSGPLAPFSVAADLLANAGNIALAGMAFMGWTAATLIAVIVYLLCVGRFYDP